MGEIYDSFCLLESLQKTHHGRRTHDDVDRLHNRIIWNSWVLAEGGEQAIRDLHVLQRGCGEDPFQLRSDEFAAYASGDRAMSSPRQQQLRRHPQVLDTLTWPVAALRLRDASLPEVNSWRNQYLNPGIGYEGAYCFPGDPAECTENRRPLWPEDIEGLYERGDVYGFLILVCLFRLYKLRREADRQWNTARYMIRALPGICRDPRASPFADQVIALTKKLLVLLPDCSIRIEVDEVVLWSQIVGPVYEPCRAIRLSSAKDGLMIPEPEEPIVPYTYRRCSSHRKATFPMAGFAAN